VVVNRILPYIKHSKKIIDIGSGAGDITLFLRQQGKDVTPVDVANFHDPRFVKPIIYDGQKLPFPDKSFDTALLLKVLHHTPDPKIVFSEASRVAKEIIVIETSYTTLLNRWFTIISDTIGNHRLSAFWSSYKTDEEWRKLFMERGFKVVDSAKYCDKKFGLPFLFYILFII